MLQQGELDFSPAEASSRYFPIVGLQPRIPALKRQKIIMKTRLSAALKRCFPLLRGPRQAPVRGPHEGPHLAFVG